MFIGGTNRNLEEKGLAGKSKKGKDGGEDPGYSDRKNREIVKTS